MILTFLLCSASHINRHLIISLDLVFVCFIFFPCRKLQLFVNPKHISLCQVETFFSLQSYFRTLIRGNTHETNCTKVLSRVWRVVDRIFPDCLMLDLIIVSQASDSSEDISTLLDGSNQANIRPY